MATIMILTTFNIDVEFEIPEFYRRLVVALLIDLLIQFFLNLTATTSLSPSFRVQT